MKKSLIYFTLLFSGVLFFNSCEESDTDLLDTVAEGKMAVVINDGEAESLACTFMNYGENMTGEVFIWGISTTTSNSLNIIFGSWENETAFTTKTYSTANESDMITVQGSYGYADEDNPVTIEIVEISATVIKGTINGKLKTETGSVNVKGAFWAVVGQQN